MAQFLLTEFLGLPTLGSIISDISWTILQIHVPILLQISWNFQITPKIYHLMVLKGVMDKKPTTSDIIKYAILSQPWNLTFFGFEILKLFCYLYGSKVPKWKCAHILLCKKYKNSIKLLKIAGLQPPDWIQRKKNIL